MHEPPWLPDLLNHTIRSLHTDTYWSRHRDDLLGPAGLHLAIFVEPYLGLLLRGRKTIESRFGVQRCPPHGRVAQGDILLLKGSGAPVTGICRVAEIWAYELDAEKLSEVRSRFSRELCAEDPAFWEARANCSLATLMRVEHVAHLRPFDITKRDRRGWVTLRDGFPLFQAAHA